MSMMNVEPSPGLLVAVSENPIASHSDRQIASPNPVPPYLRHVVPSP